MKKLSATYKGLITGAAMILISMGIYASQKSFENNLQYITYFVYIAGIIWTLVSFKKASDGNRSFKNYFSEGFKCFIVVTLMMVVFAWIFMKMHPELKEQAAANMRTGLQKAGNYTAKEIEERITAGKDYFLTMLISMTIFGYLLIGAMVTAVAAAFMSRQKKA